MDPDPDPNQGPHPGLVPDPDPDQGLALDPDPDPAQDLITEMMKQRRLGQVMMKRLKMNRNQKEKI